MTTYIGIVVYWTNGILPAGLQVGQGLPIGLLVYLTPPRGASAERKASKLSGWSSEGKEPPQFFAAPPLNQSRRRG
jgi:hypothetical protein